MQPSLLALTPPHDGPGLAPADHQRLTRQFDKVLALMLDGKWRTLRQIARAVDGSEAGCSARLRDCRKVRWGRYTVNRRRKSQGLWEYQITK